MAVLQAILPAAARSSGLSLELYRVAASSSSDEAARDFVKAAGTINNFASILKQIGTIIKEDDQLPSHEVCQMTPFTKLDFFTCIYEPSIGLDLIIDATLFQYASFLSI